jgi:hypothetical protein
MKKPQFYNDPQIKESIQLGQSIFGKGERQDQMK